MLRQIVLASGNQGKLKELREMLGPVGLDVRPQSELGVSDAPEPYLTFVENALNKARHASRETGLPALADDSGICADSLGGAPGVISARYAGEHGSDQLNNQKLVADLEPFEDKSASFYCVLVYVQHPDDPRPVIADGVWRGQIVSQPLGENGFGYDPHFWLPELGKTAAQLSPEEKNRLSHRGKALRALLEKLK
jgi:XTP/dITP diphosphohydrolase